jgi:hypothetical protein
MVPPSLRLPATVLSAVHVKVLQFWRIRRALHTQHHVLGVVDAPFSELPS